MLQKILQELAIVFENYISISLVNVPIHWKRKRRDIIYTEGKRKKKDSKVGDEISRDVFLEQKWNLSNPLGNYLINSPDVIENCIVRA